MAKYSDISGAQVKLARETLGLTQVEFGVRLKLAGRVVSNIEIGQRLLSLDEAEKINNMLIEKNFPPLDQLRPLLPVTSIYVERGFDNIDLEADMREILEALEKIREVVGEKWNVRLSKK